MDQIQDPAQILEQNQELPSEKEVSSVENTQPDKEKQKLLDELMSWKKQAKEREKQLKSIEENKLKDQNKWKEYAEAKEKELEQLVQREKHLVDTFVSEKVFNQIKAEALKQGIRPEALEDLELIDYKSKVMIDNTDGKIKVMGTPSFIESLRNQKPHWFGTPKATVNGAIPEVVSASSSTVTLDDLRKLKTEAAKDKTKWPVYEKAFKQYQLNKG
jgi:hypothetical protein